ncbi:hypothetical protein MMC25_007465 [Agyrium rufum]|nr:hypothetical protein [Agyrium rufum]
MVRSQSKIPVDGKAPRLGDQQQCAEIQARRVSFADPLATVLKAPEPLEYEDLPAAMNIFSHSDPLINKHDGPANNSRGETKPNSESVVPVGIAEDGDNDIFQDDPDADISGDSETEVGDDYDTEVGDYSETEVDDEENRMADMETKLTNNCLVNSTYTRSETDFTNHAPKSRIVLGESNEVASSSQLKGIAGLEMTLESASPCPESSTGVTANDSRLTESAAQTSTRTKRGCIAMGDQIPDAKRRHYLKLQIDTVMTRSSLAAGQNWKSTEADNEISGDKDSQNGVLEYDGSDEDEEFWAGWGSSRALQSFEPSQVTGNMQDFVTQQTGRHCIKVCHRLLNSGRLPDDHVRAAISDLIISALTLPSS